MICDCCTDGSCVACEQDYLDVVDALAHDDYGFDVEGVYTDILDEVLARPEPAVDVILKRRTAHARRAEAAATKRWLRSLLR